MTPINLEQASTWLQKGLLMPLHKNSSTDSGEVVGIRKMTLWERFKVKFLLSKEELSHLNKSRELGYSIFAQQQKSLKAMHITPAPSSNHLASIDKQKTILEIFLEGQQRLNGTSRAPTPEVPAAETPAVKPKKPEKLYENPTIVASARRAHQAVIDGFSPQTMQDTLTKAFAGPMAATAKSWCAMNPERYAVVVEQAQSGEPPLLKETELLHATMHLLTTKLEQGEASMKDHKALLDKSNPDSLLSQLQVARKAFEASGEESDFAAMHEVYINVRDTISDIKKQAAQIQAHCDAFDVAQQSYNDDTKTSVMVFYAKPEEMRANAQAYLEEAPWTNEMRSTEAVLAEAGSESSYDTISLTPSMEEDIYINAETESIYHSMEDLTDTEDVYSTIDEAEDFYSVIDDLESPETEDIYEATPGETETIYAEIEPKAPELPARPPTLARSPQLDPSQYAQIATKPENTYDVPRQNTYDVPKQNPYAVPNKEEPTVTLTEQGAIYSVPRENIYNVPKKDIYATVIKRPQEKQ